MLGKGLQLVKVRMDQIKKMKIARAVWVHVPGEERKMHMSEECRMWCGTVRYTVLLSLGAGQTLLVPGAYEHCEAVQRIIELVNYTVR